MYGCEGVFCVYFGFLRVQGCAPGELIAAAASRVRA